MCVGHQARDLQAALRGEAAQLEAFIPVLIQGAASGISDALKQQARHLNTTQFNMCHSVPAALSWLFRTGC